MLRFTLASLWERVGKLVTTALAIVLGVMFVTGTLVFTGTISANVSEQVMGDAERYSAVALAESDDTTGEPGELPREVLDDISALPEVAEAGGVVQGDAPLLDREGRAVGSVPTAGISVSDLTRHSAEEGTLPSNGDEVALASASADITGYGIGDEVEVLDPEGGTHTFTVTGLVDTGTETSLAFRGAVAFTESTVRAMTGTEGYAEIDVTGASGYSDAEVRDAVAQVVPDGAEVMTGTAFGERLADNAGADTELLGTALLLAGLVSVIVAVIVISNTFAILLAQRKREMALLRCVGARRGQVLRGVLLEASVVGLLSSVVGVLAGIGAGYAGLAFGADAFGADASGPLVVTPATVGAGLAVGTVATLVAALVPAVRATRVPPIAALRSSATAQGAERGTVWVRIVIAATLAVVSGAVTAWGVERTAEMGLVALVLGGLVAFASVVVAGPVLVRAVVTVARVLMRRLGVVSGLAADNSRRAPKRAATAMLALTVGATLITGYSVISSSAETTLASKLDEQADYQITGPVEPDPAEGGTDIAAEVVEDLTGAPGVARVISERRSEDVAGDTTVSAYFGAEVGIDVDSPVAAGDLGDLRPGSVVVHEDQAGNRKVGDEITVPTEQGDRTLEIAAITEGLEGLTGVTMDPEDFRSGFPDTTGFHMVGVTGADDAAPDELRDSVMDAVADEPTLQVFSAAQLRQELTSLLDSLFLAITALLGLAVLIAVAGVANTMTLSVLERSRESAVLRALGMTRGQVRRMLAVEAVMLSLIGAGTGVVLGGIFGWAAGVAALDGLILDIPAREIAAFLGVAVLAGLLAAVLPGRKAARTSITGALASE